MATQENQEDKYPETSILRYIEDYVTTLDYPQHEKYYANQLLSKWLTTKNEFVPFNETIKDHNEVIRFMKYLLKEKLKEKKAMPYNMAHPLISFYSKYQWEFDECKLIYELHFKMDYNVDSGTISMNEDSRKYHLKIEEALTRPKVRMMPSNQV